MNDPFTFSFLSHILWRFSWFAKEVERAVADVCSHRMFINATELLGNAGRRGTVL